jgi:hypothetical protein
MSETLLRVQALIGHGEYRVSQHGFRELVADDILAKDVLESVGAAVVIEDCPDTRKEPSVLVLQHDREVASSMSCGVSLKSKERPRCS